MSRDLVAPNDSHLELPTRERLGGGDAHIKWMRPFRGLESGIGRCLVLRLKMSTVGFFTVPFRVFEWEKIWNIMLLQLIPLRGETKK